jgi:hypothetical protein
METPEESGTSPKTEVVYLRIYQEQPAPEATADEGANQQPSENPPDEDYWAGRNRAMRKSARLAA